MRRAWFLGTILLALAACGGGEPASPGRDGAASRPSNMPAASPGAKPSAGAPRPGIVELRRWRQPVERVVVDKGGVALGPATEPLVRRLFVSHERLQDLHFFLRTYAPFRMRSPAGDLAFGGGGRVRASPVEQRMILEWVRLVAAEATGARNSDAYGLALAWHQGGTSGSCDDVAVYLTGEVRASSCSWNAEMRGRLHPAQLARLYAWFEALKPLQAAGGAEDQEPSRLIFAGQGDREATARETAVLWSLASALHRELAARRPAPPPQPVPVEEADPRGKRTKPEKAVAPPPAPQGPPLLLPPERPVPMPLPVAKLPPYVPPPPRENLTPSVPLSHRAPPDRDRGKKSNSSPTPGLGGGAPLPGGGRVMGEGTGMRAQPPLNDR
ncbi:MAG TPA: hypothetical protein VF756_02700 [Thermoanaerobaculia bacterium]